MYYIGEGVRQNYPKAMNLFTQSCEAKHVRGCYSLGLMYEQGEGKKNNLKAKEAYGRACDEKYALGCENYARLNTK